MSARALVLALAMVSPASVLAAPLALGSQKVSSAEAGAEGSKTQSTPTVTAAPADADEAAGKGVEKKTARQAAPKARKAQQRLNSLRKSCYGGVTGEISPLVRDARSRQLMEAVRLHEPTAAARPAQVLLQAGDEHPALLEAYQQALAGSELQEEKEKAKVCRELIDLLTGSKTPVEPKK